jgi:hypothetical protein
MSLTSWKNPPCSTSTAEPTNPAECALECAIWTPSVRYVVVIFFGFDHESP